MKKLPETVEIGINGITIDGIVVEKIYNKDIPTILYNERLFITVQDWVYLQFGIHPDNAYFSYDNNKKILRIILDYPHKLDLSNIERLRLYNNVSISNNLNMENENPYLAIEIRD